MSIFHTQAITLKSQRWGEADRIITFFTQRFGKVRGVAREARKMRSRFGGCLEPFFHTHLTGFEKGQDPLWRINQVDVQESFWGLRTSLDHMGAAASLVNLVMGLAPDRDSDPALFQLLLNGLGELEQAEDPTLVALIFQMLVLGHTGFRPQVEQCAVCGKSCHANRAMFSPRAGGRVCSGCEERKKEDGIVLSSGSLAFIQQVRRLDTSAAYRLKATGQIRIELHHAIESYIQVVLEKPMIGSRRWATEMVGTNPR